MVPACVVGNNPADLIGGALAIDGNWHPYHATEHRPDGLALPALPAPRRTRGGSSAEKQQNGAADSADACGLW